MAGREVLSSEFDLYGMPKGWKEAGVSEQVVEDARWAMAEAWTLVDAAATDARKRGGTGMVEVTAVAHLAAGMLVAKALADQEVKPASGGSG